MAIPFVYKLIVGDHFGLGVAANMGMVKHYHREKLRAGDHKLEKLQAAYNELGSKAYLYVEVFQHLQKDYDFMEMEEALRQVEAFYEDDPFFCGAVHRWEVSARQREKMSKAKISGRNPKARKVRITWPDGTSLVFPSLMDASAALGVSNGLISYWLTPKSQGPGRSYKMAHLRGVKVAYEEPRPGEKPAVVGLEGMPLADVELRSDG